MMATFCTLSILRVELHLTNIEVFVIVGCVCFRCDVLVGAYVADTDPEARLLVGADMRKIQLCFQLLKVHCCRVLHPCRSPCITRFMGSLTQRNFLRIFSPFI